MNIETVKQVFSQLFNYVGSSVPLIILCYMIVFILHGKKVKWKTVISYVVVAVIMFMILLLRV